MTWRLDGEARTDKLPSRIRGISPAAHRRDRRAARLHEPEPCRSPSSSARRRRSRSCCSRSTSPARSRATPPGATVSLIVDGKRETLGPSPAKTKLDPRKTYQVLFEKPGYVSVNRPIVFTGATEEKIVVTLEKAGARAVAACDARSRETEPSHRREDRGRSTDARRRAGREDRRRRRSPATEAATRRPRRSRDQGRAEAETKVEPKPETEGGAGGRRRAQGTLLLGSKPPCDIFIDGKSTGLQTPQRDIKLSAGKHKITLVNNEFGIKETFAVDIKADAAEKQIKDYSDRIPKSSRSARESRTARVKRALPHLALFLVLTGVYVLSGPGRIDIIDGQYRFDVTRSLVEVGRPTLRDPMLDAWSGRSDGSRYSGYGPAASLAAVPLVAFAHLRRARRSRARAVSVLVHVRMVRRARRDAVVRDVRAHGVSRAAAR